METVNQYMLEDLLNPLGGSADIDEGIVKYRDTQSENEEDVKRIILEEIKPYYDNKSEDYKYSLKRSLAYFLTTNRANFGRLYDSALIAFDHPTDPRNFFLWTWEVLFPSENYYIDNVKDYKEIDDIHEANSYL